MFKVVNSILFLLAVLLLHGCGGGYYPLEPKDAAPRTNIDPSTLKDAVPRHDPITRAGNTSPYTVLGKTYTVMPSSKDYSETGIASWYGTKFHGRPTANGERYDIYQMTAAHRSLPIPSYVRVTNLANGQSTIVRVNDRGPFHDQRIIDLSYAAAVKLGYHQQGTARVKLEAIDVTIPNPSSPLPPSRYYLQAGAFKSLSSAQNLRGRLQILTQQNVKVRTSQPAGFYRVWIGPMTNLNDVAIVSEQILAANMEQPRLIAE